MLPSELDDRLTVSGLDNFSRDIFYILFKVMNVSVSELTAANLGFL